MESLPLQKYLLKLQEYRQECNSAWKRQASFPENEGEQNSSSRRGGHKGEGMEQYGHEENNRILFKCQVQVTEQRNIDWQEKQKA